MEQYSFRLQHYFLYGILLFAALLLSGCGKPNNSGTNFTNSLITLTSLNDNEPFKSDVLTNGYGQDDVISATLISEFRAAEDGPTAPDGPSVYDTVIFHSYHVAHQRSDGGPDPADFTAGLSVGLAPGSETQVNLVIVRAFDKHKSPLEELRDDGEIFTTTTVTIYGQDGYGNDVAVSGSLGISFANFPDQ